MELKGEGKMIVTTSIGGVLIEVGRDSQNCCVLSNLNEPASKVEVWKQDWEEMKRKIDKMFKIVGEPL